MSYRLEPRILSKLRAFADRRRKLLIIRGVCSAVAMLLATMMMVAFIDKLFLLPDEVRWGLSAAAYLAVLIVEWRVCLGQLTRAPGPRRLARLIEHAEPKLREDLLSAVELGTPDGEEVFDSEQFRQILQADVAERMDGLRVDRLLPVNLLKRYLGVAAVLVLAVTIAFVATGFQFGTLMLRALFPGMNLGRVSATQVEIVQPHPAEMVVAHGDAVPIEIKISGRPASKAVLEIFTASDKRERVPLNATSENVFTGTIQVGREDVRYRIMAGDAITQKYLLDAEPRPYVVNFEKTFTPPAYIKMAPQTKTEENGDLVGLEGSEVELKLAVNVPITSGELRMDYGQEDEVIPLTKNADGKMVGKVTLGKSGTYRVHLVGEKTAFENKFSPEYELRAEPDLVPGVELAQPAMDLIVPANELVDFSGVASDDLAVSELALHIRINDGRWESLPIPIEAAANVPFQYRWDLIQQGVRAGDIVTAKVVALDLKGNRGESRPIQISVTSAGFEMKRLTALEAWRALADSLRVWRESSDALAKVSGETRQRIEQSGESDPVRLSQLKIFGEAYQEFDQRYGEAVLALTAALRASLAGHESAELVLLGRLLAKAEAGTAQRGRTDAEVAGANIGEGFAKDLAREMDDAINRALQRARLAEESFRTLLTAAEVDVLAENVQILDREQERISELARQTGDEASKWKQIATRLRVMLSETKSFEELLVQVGDREGAGDRARNIAQQFAKRRQGVEKLLTNEAPSRKVMDPVNLLGETIRMATRDVLELRNSVGRKPIETTKAMSDETGSLWTNFERLRDDLNAIAQDQKWNDFARSALAAGEWNARETVFKAHGDVEEIRPTSDALFVADVRSTSVALHGMQDLSPSDGNDKTREKIEALDRAFRLLEGGHDLQELLDGMNNLAANERWQISSPRARTADPRDWNWLEERLRRSPDELKRMNLAGKELQESIEAVCQVLWGMQKLESWKRLDREMEQRRNPARAPESQRVEANELAEELKKALALLRPQMELARQQVADMAPKLSELAAALAKEAEQLKEKTQEQEQAAPQKPPEQSVAEAQQALAEQENLNAKLEPLKDLLRADANRQDILDAAERERARDADDALAMLKEPPPKAQEALQ
ncbi:MAG: hypothetical protein ABI680_15405, partial [Chthoniobacteraceae bacterium]